MRAGYVRCIAMTTFRESIRSKILYAVLCFAALMVVAGTLFGSVSIGDLEVVIKDFGLFSITLMSVAFVIISGTTLLHKELFRKTIFNLLSKSVTRGEFIAGKFFGLLLVAAMIVALMTVALVAFVAIFEQRIDWAILWAASYLILELSILCAVALLFSTIVITPFLSGMFTFGIFLAGRSTEYILKLIPNEQSGGDGGSIILSSLYWLLPHLDELNVANLAAYGTFLPASHLLWGVVYATAYSFTALTVAWFIFNRRDFNQ